MDLCTCQLQDREPGLEVLAGQSCQPSPTLPDTASDLYVLSSLGSEPHLANPRDQDWKGSLMPGVQMTLDEHIIDIDVYRRLRCAAVRNLGASSGEFAAFAQVFFMFKLG